MNTTWSPGCSEEGKNCTCAWCGWKISVSPTHIGGSSAIAARQVFELEVRFVVDRSVTDRYIAEQTFGDSAMRKSNAMVSLKADIDYFITEINELFASLRPKGLNIIILKQTLDILNINLFLDNVPSSVALKAFRDWSAKQLPAAYDAAILWTGHRFQQSGRAYIGRVCNPVYATGIVFYDMTYQVTIITAHELGHIMGARHDPANSGYVMGPVNRCTDTNRWQFSLASKNAFDVVIAKPRSRCLKRTSASSTAISAGVTAALANPETICRRARRSKRSYMCKVNTDDFIRMLLERKYRLLLVQCFKTIH
ncbi:metalloproteinase [Plakobranchus ocellatus]|uniref:Metalloproteinase n=1 Tax=Plakobranchus ocellatus TaxID=259542 RepID=A0AAV4D7Q1_9GAST|nr:metalloproteinase [Plakobranchus ocellatus]